MKRLSLILSLAVTLTTTSFTLASDHAAPAAKSTAHAPAPKVVAIATPSDTHGPKLPSAKADPHVAPALDTTAIDPLQRLKEGNARYLADKPIHANQDAARRTDTATNGQHPFAIILSCADSRVPPEVLFDQGIGDLFCVRVAGNVAGPDELGSIEYAVEHLHAPLIVVLGHTRCGAVAASLKPGELPPNLNQLIEKVTPVAAQTRKENPTLEGPALAAAAEKNNVQNSLAQLLTKSSVIAEFVHSGKVKVVGGIYDISTGSVTITGPHPDEANLLQSASAHHTPAPASADAHAPAHTPEPVLAAMTSLTTTSDHVAPSPNTTPLPPTTVTSLDPLLNALRQRTKAHPQALNYALALQLLESAESNKPTDPNTLQSLSPVDQKFIPDLATALTQIAAQPNSPTSTLHDRVAPLLETARKWENEGGINLPRLALASRVDSFGVYTPIEPRFTFGQHHTVIIYCEVANFATQKIDDHDGSIYRANLAQQDTLVTDDGFLVWRPNPVEVEDRSRNQRRDFYLVKKLTIPDNLAVGKYSLRLSVTDKNSKHTAVATLPVEIIEK